MTFGEYYKQLRIKSGQTLRSYCNKHGFYSPIISKIERDRLAPAKWKELRERHALALGLIDGSDGWYEFFDKIEASTIQNQREELDDSEVLRRLPIFVGFFGGQIPSAERLDQLIELIRKT